MPAVPQAMAGSQRSAEKFHCRLKKACGFSDGFGTQCLPQKQVGLVLPTRDPPHKKHGMLYQSRFVVSRLFTPPGSNHQQKQQQCDGTRKHLLHRQKQVALPDKNLLGASGALVNDRKSPNAWYARIFRSSKRTTTTWPEWFKWAKDA